MSNWRSRRLKHWVSNENEDARKGTFFAKNMQNKKYEFNTIIQQNN